MQPLTTLAQAALGQLGTRHHLDEGDGTEQEVLVLGEQNSAEARGKERSGVLSGHHYEKTKTEPASSNRPEPPEPSAPY